MDEAKKQNKTPTVIVTGNIKGGSGKSTTAVHIIVALLRADCSVGSIDLDYPQLTISRYLKNRETFIKEKKRDLPMPIHKEPTCTSPSLRDKELLAFLHQSFEELSECDYIVIDTPGADTEISCLAHSYAKILVTPINDSFVDLDLLGEVSAKTLEVEKLSRYSELVFQARMLAAQRTQSTKALSWFVMRNRISNLSTNNDKSMLSSLDALAHRLGFRILHGFSERVIFKELFLDGLTLIDLRFLSKNIKLTLSHISARQEIRELIQGLGLPLWKEEATPHNPEKKTA